MTIQIPQYIIRVNGARYFAGWKALLNPDITKERERAAPMSYNAAQAIAHQLNNLYRFQAKIEPVKESHGQ